MCLTKYEMFSEPNIFFDNSLSVFILLSVYSDGKKCYLVESEIEKGVDS